MRKFGNTAGDDLENLISVAGEGAQKLQGKLLVGMGSDTVANLTRAGAIRSYLNS